MLLEHVHTMDELTDEEFGKFVRAYASYIETGVEPNFSDRSMRMMWKTIKAFDDKNREKYAETSRKRKKQERKVLKSVGIKILMEWQTIAKIANAIPKMAKMAYMNMNMDMIMILQL